MNKITIRSSRSAMHASRSNRDLAVFANFRRHVGATGRSYLVSVYPIESCPDYVDAIVMAVGRSLEGFPTIVWIGDTGEGGDSLRTALRSAQDLGAHEAHVHLLAGDPRARAAVIRDLDRRH